MSSGTIQVNPNHARQTGMGVWLRCSDWEDAKSESGGISKLAGGVRAVRPSQCGCICCFAGLIQDELMLDLSLIQ